MIDLYSWATPNGMKLHILLEELAIPYTLHPVNIGKGEQFEPDFLEISPNNKIPALVDHDGPDGKSITLFESGAMMMYLAEKTGQFMPSETLARYEVIQWLMFQMGGVGPMFGQHAHFSNYAPEKIPYAIDRYTKECLRLFGVMDRRLEQSEFLAGGTYSIADIATYGWAHIHDRLGLEISEFENVGRWLDWIGDRPAVQTGVELLTEHRKVGEFDKETLKNYFGEAQHAQLNSR